MDNLNRDNENSINMIEKKIPMMKIHVALLKHIQKVSLQWIYDKNSCIRSIGRKSNKCSIPIKFAVRVRWNKHGKRRNMRNIKYVTILDSISPTIYIELNKKK